MPIKTFGKTGQQVKLNKASVYNTCYSTEPFSTLSGTYYLWSNYVFNDVMVRITDSEKNTYDMEKSIGWINITSSSISLVPIPKKITTTTVTQTTVQTSSQEEDDLRQKPVDFMTKHLGEGSHKMVDIYNGSPLTKGQKANYGTAWCAIAVTAAFIDTGLAGSFNSNYPFRWSTHTCTYMRDQAKKQGRYYKGSTHIPKKGDILLSNTGSKICGHVGIVTGFKNNTVYTIEGNTSLNGNKIYLVRKNQYTWGGSKIHGVIVPEYSKMVKTTTTTTTSTTQTNNNNSGTSNNTATTNKGTFGTKGQGVTLKNTVIYKDNVEKKSTKKYSGTYYIWDTTTYNNRVRICKKANEAGVKGKIVGWVYTSKVTLIVPQSKKTSNFKVGDKVMATNDAVWTNGNWVPLWLRKSVLYVVKIANVEKMGVSTAKNGDVLGYINQKYLRKA